MNSVNKYTQAYSQAPWRKQLQLIGLFLLLVVFVGLVAGMYLNVTARAATIGREIFELQRDLDRVERENENLRSQLAALTSTEQMALRARALGFVPVAPDEAVYLVIPGYVARQPVTLAPPREPMVMGWQAPPGYSESIFEWLVRQDPQSLMDTAKQTVGQVWGNKEVQP